MPSRRIVVFTYKATKEIEERISKWLDLLEYPYKLYNIPQTRPEKIIEKGDVIIAFGAVPSSLVDQHLKERGKYGEIVVELPKPDSLKKKKENAEDRQRCLESLEQLKKTLKEDRFQPTEITIKEEDLPALEKQHISMLKELTEGQGKESCFQTTKDGQLIEISNSLTKGSEADIHLTFAELYTVRQVMDILKVDEVQIVRNTKNNSY